MKQITYDFVVIGGGIFGSYTALYLAQQGLQGLLIEKEKQLFSKASLVNQARLHSGYHYPRSIATARMSHEHQNRFTTDHKDFINFQYEKYYAIDRFASLTDGQQFQRFCDFIGATCTPVSIKSPFDSKRMEALFKTTEYSFDPILLKHYYQHRLHEHSKISIATYTQIKNVEKSKNNWQIHVQKIGSQEVTNIKTPLVVNATYTASNSIHQLFNLPYLTLQHEIAEIVLLTTPALKNIGLTIMDGQFGSIMPYGLTGLHSLSSVAYTHHRVSRDLNPTFHCQQQTNCQPHFPANCNYCPVRPTSNFNKMYNQITQYFDKSVSFSHYQSLFTIKSKLQANHIDDGRPTEISQLASNPDFYCIFAGKINSIYEIEKVIKRAVN